VHARLIIGRQRLSFRVTKPSSIHMSEILGVAENVQEPAAA
jgi:hypothetical protein